MLPRQQVMTMKFMKYKTAIKKVVNALRGARFRGRSIITEEPVRQENKGAQQGKTPLDVREAFRTGPGNAGGC